MGDQRTPEQLQVADSIYHDVTQWKSRALAGNPNNVEMERGFLLGVAMFLIEQVGMQTSGGDTIAERWATLGNRAAMEVFEGE